MPKMNYPQASQEYVEKLFAHLYADLDQRIRANDDNFRMYNQLNIARLTRQLLIDEAGVFNQANKYHKLPIRFIVAQVGPAPTSLKGIQSIYSDSLPDLNNFPPGHYLHPHNIDGYLAHSQIILADRNFSVREIIKYVANQFGGVHLSPYLKEEDDQLLARFNHVVRVGNDGIVLNCVNEIAQVTLRALRPLMKAIQDKYDALEMQSSINRN